MLQKSVAALAVALVLAGAAQAQNVAIVNGKPVPKSRVDTLMVQATRGGQQPVTPEIEARVREEVVLREIFAQEADAKGIAASPDYQAQMELARQSLLIRELFADFQKKNPVTDDEARAEYEKVKAQAGSAGTEFQARHILVDKEELAKSLTAQLKRGAKFEDLAKKYSKDTESAKRGGELGFSTPDKYVPEFGRAMAALKKGETTPAPVKSEFGWHIIRVDDTRAQQFPAFDDVRPQLQQRVMQQKIQAYQDKLRDAAKTDFKFSGK